MIASLITGRAWMASLLFWFPISSRPPLPPVSSIHQQIPDTLQAAIAEHLRKGAGSGIDARAWRRIGKVYADREFAPAWIDVGGDSEARMQALRDALARADNDGLRAADYPLDALTAAVTATRHAPTPRQLAWADVLLTGALAMYVEDLLRGRLDPRAIESAWRIDPRVANIDSALTATIDSATHGADALRSALERLTPRAEGYAELVRELRYYRDIVRRGGWPTVAPGPALHLADTSTRVPMLRRRLAIENDVPNVVTLNGGLLFDRPLASAVAQFQAKYGLEADTVVGPRTLAALNIAADQRARQIEASLERLRWLPPDLGERYVMVNIPAFRLDAFAGGRPVLSMRVVVGADYGRRGTPIFSDSISYVVFNPYWNVPSGIAARELWPKQRRDPSYFRRNGYEVVRASWGSYVRQRPGPDNALGRVKFIFPNDFSVYLHDTPSRDLFAERVRAFSHGCIRVEQPLELARFILGPRGWDRPAVTEAVAGGPNRRVDLAEKLPVYIIYLTAFVREGKVAFRDDLYGHDERILRALQ